MKSRFLVDDEKVRRLAATRQGRISIGGFTYQAAYAVARLASMNAREPLPDLRDVPVALRYDWAEDLDEVDDDGHVYLTQCKQMDDIGQPSKLAGVLLGFAPKWLWAPAARRDGLRFRLVCTDLRFRANGPIALGMCDSEFDGARVRTAMVTTLTTPAPDRSDRALWQSAATALGHEALAHALWQQTEVLYVRADALLGDPTGVLLLHAERQGLDLLVRWNEIDAHRQQEALTTLRATLHTNLVRFDPACDELAGLTPRDPRVIERADIRAALFELRAARSERVWFRVVGRRYLEEQALQAKRAYVARPPEWSDVVHGEDPDVHFVERDITKELIALMREHVVEPLERGRSARLPAVIVLGAPGSGKSTLVRRAAALLVQAGAVTVADPGVNLPPIVRDDFQAMLSELTSLAADGRPVLLLLDDPFFAESGWDAFLEQLGRCQQAIGVLGASPDFLFEKFGGRAQRGQISTKTLTLPPPSAMERSTLARLYGRALQALSAGDEDLLVLAMEAAAGEPFVDIVARIWTTLNDGRPIDLFTLPAALPWPVRAYIVTCYFHRAYVRCPETLLRQSLVVAGGEDAPENYRYQMDTLALREGWRIFSVEAPAIRLVGFLGRTIGAAHQRIARTAWQLRPAPAFDVADWVIPASIRVELPDPVAELAGALKGAAGSTEANLAERLATEWSTAAASGIRTIPLVSVSSRLDVSGATREARLLEPALLRRASADVPDEESWLAALQLWFLSSSSPPARRFPPVDLTSLIDVANFSIAGRRAVQFAGAIGAGAPQYSAIVRRLLTALDGHLNWTVSATLLTWLLAHADWTELSGPRLAAVHDFLDDHPKDVTVRLKLLAILMTSSSLSLFLAALQDSAKALDGGRGDHRWEGLAASCAGALRQALRRIDEFPEPAAAWEALRMVQNSVLLWFASVGAVSPDLDAVTDPTPEAQPGFNTLGDRLTTALGRHDRQATGLAPGQPDDRTR